MSSLTALDTAVLWSHDWSPEFECQSHHCDEGNLVCSGPATHVNLTKCEGAVFICGNAAIYCRESLLEGNTHLCGICMDVGVCRYIGDCWKITKL